MVSLKVLFWVLFCFWNVLPCVRKVRTNTVSYCVMSAATENESKPSDQSEFNKCVAGPREVSNAGRT